MGESSGPLVSEAKESVIEAHLRAPTHVYISGGTFTDITGDQHVHQANTYNLSVDLSRLTNGPWTLWMLNKKFFKSLSKYCFKHPTTTLERVLDRLFSAFANGEECQAVIPGGKFPARALLIALSFLVKLGFVVPQAKDAAHEFAGQVVSWVTYVKSAFELRSCRYIFTCVTWKRLLRMRDLVNEVCLWAYCRIVDGRWTRHAMAAMEIEKFNSCISEVKVYFRDLQAIAIGMDTRVMREASALILNREDVLVVEVEKIRRVQQEQWTPIVDVHEKVAQDQAEIQQFLDSLLSRHVVKAATYSEQGKDPCEEDTRVDVLSKLMVWIQNISPGTPNFLWLTGDPGSGKSAVAASLTRDCIDQDTLWAQFFISRRNAESINPDKYFPSIARQLADRHPAVASTLYDRLKKKRTLVDHISLEQAMALFIDALIVASLTSPRKPVVVTIDALDETDRNLKEVATVFSHLFGHLVGYPNVKIVLSSRSENAIQDPFAKKMLQDHIWNVHLYTKDSIDDVGSFLRRKVSGIVADNHLSWKRWPTEDGMVKLATRASGLFIWATTVVKFFKGQIDMHGTEGLGKLLGQLTADALDDMNDLYNFILKIGHNKHATEWDYEKFRRIVGAIVVLRQPLHLEGLMDLLDLRQTPREDPVDLPHFVRRFRTVLVAGVDTIHHKTVPRLHRSFEEFVTGQKVDFQFRVDKEASEADVGLRCLYRFGASYPGFMESEKCVTLPWSLRYAFQYWLSHLDKGGIKSGVIIGSDLMRAADAHSISSSSIRASCSPSLFISSSFDESQLVASYGEGRRSWWDMKDGSNAPRVVPGHQHEILCVAFSPDGKNLVAGTKGGSLSLWDWQIASHLGSFVGHTNWVRVAVFSPTGNLIASGSDDLTIRLWDPETFHIRAVLEGHRHWILSISFAPDGTTIASGSEDKSIRLWDRNSGKVLGPPLEGHAAGVRSVAFIGGDLIVSASQDGVLQLWNRNTDQLAGQPVATPLVELFSAAVSPNGEQIVAAGRNGICLLTRLHDKLVLGDTVSPSTLGTVGSATWTPNGDSVVLRHFNKPYLSSYHIPTGVLSPFPYQNPPTRHYLTIPFALSIDGSYIALDQGSDVRIWDMPWRPAASLTAAFFSADGKLVVSTFSDDSLWLFNTRLVPCIGSRLRGHVGRIQHFTFSSDNTFLCGTTNDNAYLWDTSSATLRASHALDIQGCIDFQIIARNEPIVYSWDIAAGRLVASDNEASLVPTLLQADLRPLLGKFDAANACMVTGGAQWYPTHDSRVCVRAYLDDYMIIGGENGSVVLIPLAAQMNNLA